MEIGGEIEIVTEILMEGEGVKNFLECYFPNFKIFISSSNSFHQDSCLKNNKLIIIDTDSFKKKLGEIGLLNKCIIYSQTKIPGLIIHAQKLKAGGYVSKNSSSNRILNCIKVINLDGTYYDPCFANLLGKVSEFEKQLSPSQKEVFNSVLLYSESSIIEIAGLMKMSKHTLEVHLSNIYQKAGVNSFQELINLFSL